MKKSPTLVAKILGSHNQKSKSLISEAKRLSQIKIIINQSLDQQLAEHVYVSTINNGLLTLVVDSPVWATRLRYMQQEIIKRFKKFSVSKNITSISVKVRPLEFPTQKPKKQHRHLSISRDSAARMQEELDAISDPALQDSLKRIVKRAK